MMVPLLSCFSFSSKDEREKPVPSSVMDNLNLGIHIDGGKMAVLIPKNAKFPLKAEKRIKTIIDYQTVSSINVYEGESSFIKDNILIGGFKLDGLPPAPKGIANCKLCFEVDANGTLKVSAVDTISCKLMKEIKITSAQRRSAKILNARNTLQDYANAIKQTLGDARYKGKPEVANEKKIMKVANKAIKWLNTNQTAKIYEYESRQKELEALWNPIVTKLYQNAAGGGGPSPPPNKAKPESCSPAPNSARGPSPVPNKVMTESCSFAPPKAGSVLHVVD